MKLSRLAAAAPGDRPTRLFIFYLPHGSPIEHFDPVNPDGSLNLTASGSGILSPLVPYQDKVTVVRGVSMNGATNHAAISCTITGQPGGSGADSIDYTIAQGLGVVPHALGAIPYTKGAGFSSDSYLIKHGSWVRPTEDPVQAAEALLPGSGSGGTPTEPTDNAAVFRQETLALTERQLEGLQNSLQHLSAEQDKLSLHLEAVRNLKSRSSGGSDIPSSVDCSSLSLPAVDAIRGQDVLDPSNFAKVLDAQLEVAANAFYCGTARVITLQNMHVNADMNMGFPGGPGISKGHHQPISHSWDEAGRAEFATVQSWFYERLAEKLLKVLDQDDPADPGHTVLDNSIIYVCSEVSDGANHNSDANNIWINGKEVYTYLPAIIIGGGGGYFRTGQVAQVDVKNTDVLATLAAAMGVPVTSIGGQSVSEIPELKA